VWRLVLFFAVLALAAGAFGALALPRLAVVAPPEQWRLAAERPEAPPTKARRCRHEERPALRPFDDAR
jgi:hypothetical protein